MPGRGMVTALPRRVMLIAGAAAGHAAGDVSVEGNQFLPRQHPWVAEGVTLVGLVSPEKQTQGKQRLCRGAGRRSAPACSTRSSASAPNSCAFRSARPASTRSRRSTIPNYRDEVLDADRLDPGGRFNVIVVDAVAGSSPAPGTDAGCPRRRHGGPGARSPGARGVIRGILLEIFNEPAIGHAGPKDWRKLAGGDAAADRLAAQGRGRRTCCWSAGVQYSRSFENAPLLHDPLGQLGYAVHPLPRPVQPDPRATGRRSSATSPRTHPVMATAFNAQAGGGYCRPELPEQAEDSARLSARDSRSASSPGRLTCRTCASQTGPTPPSTTLSADSATPAAAAGRAR